MSNIVDSAQNIDFEDPHKSGPTGDQLKDVLQEAGVIMSVPSGGIGSEEDYVVSKKFARPDGTIDEQLVYNELAELIAEGSNIVKQLKYADINAEGTLSGMASVLASMRQMIADFAKIHSDYIKHKQRLEVEKFKEDSKLRLLERKHEMDMEKLRESKRIEVEDDGTKGSITYSQKDIIRLLTSSKNADKKEDE